MRRLLLALTVILVIAAACDSGEEPPKPTITPPPTLALSPTPTGGPTLTPTDVPRATPTPNPRTSADRAEDQTYMRVINAAENFAPIDLYIDTLGIAFNLAFGDLTSPTPIGVGEFVLRVMPSGARLDGEIQPYLEQTISISSGQLLTFVLSGTEPFLTILNKDISTPLQLGESRVGIINAIPDAPGLTIRSGGADLILPVNYGEQAIPANVPSGATTFTVNGGETVVTTLVEPSLRERFSYTYVLFGSMENPQVAQFSDRVRGETSLRAINMVSDVPSIDMYLNGELFINTVDYGRASSRQNLRADNYQITVYPAGADPATANIPLAVFNLSTIEEQVITLIVIGTAADAAITRYDDDLSPVPPEQARMTFINAASQDAVTVELGGSTPIEGLGVIPYRDQSISVLFDLEPTYSFIVHAGEQGVEYSENIQLQAGRSYLYFITGKELDAPPVILSDTVQIDRSLTVPDEDAEQQPDIARDPARIRIINMLRDRAAVDVYLDTIPLALNLEHAILTPEVIIPAGIQSVIIRAAGSGAIPQSEAADNDPNTFNIVGYDFQPNATYTVYVYGLNGPTNELMIQMQTSGFVTTTDAMIRMVNLTNQGGETSFGLAIASPDQVIAQVSIDPTAQASGYTIPPNRSMLYDGTYNIIQSVENETGSPVQLVPGSPQHIFIIDRQLSLLAKTEFNYPFQAGIFYDVIVSQAPNSTEVNLYIVPYDN